MSPPKKDRKIQSISGKTFPDVEIQMAGDSEFVIAIARALRRDYGGMYAAVKVVVALTGANERAVKNWFAAKNGPNGENLVKLMRHSDEVLETVLLRAKRVEQVKAKKLSDYRKTLEKMLAGLLKMEE